MDPVMSGPAACRRMAPAAGRESGRMVGRTRGLDCTPAGKARADNERIVQLEWALVRGLRPAQTRRATDTAGCHGGERGAQ